MATSKMIYQTVSKGRMIMLGRAISSIRFQGFLSGDTNRGWRADGKRDVKTLWNEREDCYDYILIEPVGPQPRRRYQLRRSETI